LNDEFEHAKYQKKEQNLCFIIYTVYTSNVLNKKAEKILLLSKTMSG